VVRPNQPGLGDHVANASFMVDPTVRGMGIGRQLGEAVIERTRAAGYRALQFNAVVATNAAAIRLWESLGFEVVGRVPQAFRHAEHGLVDLLVMHRFC
jgi:L-amino acid N-acyltransferase YncA